ncbi:hypothetical protein Sjap_009376 [Stephania japonica]|uniref:Disease resistance protein RGA3 n=1 Tax=Stephania japonica TaxID=461633 RepID=A0AAP0JTP6_9MAGN
MAEAIFINGVGMILKSVAAHVERQIAVAWGAKGELNKLRHKLVILQLVLDDAEKRQVREPLARYWLEKLKGVAYKAQDVMDDFSYETTRQEMEVPAVPHPLMRLFFDMVLNICSTSNPILFLVKMGRMIREINGEFNKIKIEMEEFNFIKGNVFIKSNVFIPGDAAYNSAVRVSTRLKSNSSSIDKSEIVGREAEYSRLVALLTDLDASVEQKRLSVLPIVGMGGLGKTTLAQLIYNDRVIKSYFKDLRMWVDVSQEFNVENILEGIVKNYGRRERSDIGEPSNKLTRIMQRKLDGKRFLLVLDNVWSADGEKWKNLEKPLVCGAMGSKIIVTTSRYEVASLVGTLETYVLKPLSEEDAWSLFKQRAFPSPTTSHQRQDLAEIGRLIVKRCGGVPLALSVIGSELRSKREDLHEWLSVQNSETWNIEIMRKLMVSYLLLPSNLKQCFSYCSVFRKGESIEIQTLVQLWMAEGFINGSSNQNENMLLEEDVGRQYAISLMNSCFFEAEKRDSWGDQVISFKMHDLVHDLAKFVVSPLDRTSVFTNSIKEGDARRLQVAFTKEGTSTAMHDLGDLVTKVNSDRLRVLILNNLSFECLPIDKFSSIMNLKRLRVLILKHLVIEELLDSVASLKHLRYLDLSYTKVKVLPESFTALYNLQTLKLVCCEVTKLPSDFTRKLNKLRHLEIGGPFSALEEMPKVLSRLKFLQTWPVFKVSKESGRHISELGPLKHLKGELLIDHLENVPDMKASKSANLASKQNIRQLNLTWSNRFINDGTSCNYDDVLEGLQPHRNLKALKISNFMGAKFPTWLTINTKLLPNLVEMELDGLDRCESLPAFGSLPLLRSLFMNGMRSVKRIGSEFYGDARPPFPSLKKLYISGFRSLEEWVEAPTLASRSSPLSSLSAFSFPVLEELKVDGSVQLNAMPTLFPMLTTLEVREIRGSIVTSLGTSGNLKALTSLAISTVLDLFNLPPKFLSNNKHLKHLEIVGCAGIQTIPAEELQCLTSLEELKIGGFLGPCDPITQLDLSFPFLSVPNGESSDKFLPRLKTLELRNSRIASLPNCLEHFTTIETLKIAEFPNIADLPDWLGNFSSLRELYLSHCHNLMHFPAAKAMQRLTSLTTLSMTMCNQLEARCMADGGEEWHKISHIPSILRQSHA